jgi:hypothetical protein
MTVLYYTSQLISLRLAISLYLTLLLSVMSDTGIYCANDDFVNKPAGSCTYGIDVIGESLSSLHLTMSLQDLSSMQSISVLT